MAITLVNVGTYLASISSVTQTISLPTGMQSGDLIILVIACGEDSPQPSIVTPPANYTQRPVADNFYDYGPGGMSQWAFWKIHSGSESNPSFTLNTGASTGGGIYGYAMAFRGVSNTTPFDIDTPDYGNSSGSGSSTTYQPPAVQTNTTGSCIVSIVQTSDDNGLNLQTANGFTISAVAEPNYKSSTGSDSSFGMAYQVTGSAGTYDMPVWQQVNLGPDYWAYQTMVLKDGTAVNNYTRTNADSISSISEAVGTSKVMTRSSSASISSMTEVVASSRVMIRTDADSISAITESTARSFTAGRGESDSIASMTEGPARTGTFTRRESRPGD
jgi:hypothetical protein